MVATITQATKARREQKVSSLIDSGGLESSKMSTEQSRTVDNVSFTEGGREEKAPVVLMMVTAGSSQLHFIQDDYRS